jgi:hypothetical protein
MPADRSTGFSVSKIEKKLECPAEFESADPF